MHKALEAKVSEPSFIHYAGIGFQRACGPQKIALHASVAGRAITGHDEQDKRDTKGRSLSLIVRLSVRPLR